MDARSCREVRAADKRGARGVGGDGSPPKKLVICGDARQR